jgi:hypothetical protein
VIRPHIRSILVTRDSQCRARSHRARQSHHLEFLCHLRLPKAPSTGDQLAAAPADDLGRF